MATPSTTYGQLGRSGLDDQILGRVYDHAVVARLSKYVLPYKRWTLLALAGLLGYIVTTIAQPLIIAWGISGFIAPPQGVEAPWGNIHIVGLVFFGNLLANTVFNYVHYYALSRLSINILYDLQTEMFSHLQRQALSFYDRNEVGRIMSRVQNDVLQIEEFTEVAIMTLSDLAMLAFIAGTMLLMDWRLALATMATIPVLLAAMVLWQRSSRGTFVRVRQAISAVNGSLQENISGVRVAQSMNRQGVNLQRFDRLNRENMEATVHASWLSAVLLPMVEVLTVASLALVVVLGGAMVAQGVLAVGILVAFLLYVQRFFDPIRTLTMQFTQFQRAMVSGARIFELLDIQPELADRPSAQEMLPIRGDIRLENVSFSYVPGIEVLHDVSLHVEPGQTMALVGLTGAGKTTMVSLVARFYDVQQGRIAIDGHDVRDVTRESLAQQMSMVLQEPFLYSATVKENIRYRHRGVTDEEIVAAAKVVGAHDYILGLENGYDTVLQQRGANLSMGQRQLLSFARAVAANPRILILDEATANIDSHTEQLIQEALGAVLQGRTSIVIAHRLSTITRADKIVVLHRGRIEAVGTHAELLARGGLYAELYAMNFGETLEGTGADLSRERAGLDSLQNADSGWSYAD